MDKRCLCIVMDYADGGDLYTKIANQKKIGRGKFTILSIISTSDPLQIIDRLFFKYSVLQRRLNSRLVRLNGTSYKAHPRQENLAS